VLYRAVLLFLEVLRWLPSRARALLGRMAGWAAHSLVSRRREIVMRNLELCFPRLDADARRQFARENFRAAGVSFLDFLWLIATRMKEGRSFIRLEGGQYLKQLGDGPVIFLAPHFFGMISGFLRIRLEREAAVFMKEPHSPLSRKFLRDSAQRLQVVYFSNRDPFSRVLRWLKEGNSLYYLPDVNAPPGGGTVFAPLLGVEEAATMTSLSRLARATGALVLPCVTYMREEGGYTLHLHPPWRDFPTGDDLADARRMNRFLEESIKQAPSEYFWLHRRFKTRPPGAPPLYGPKGC